MESFTLHIPTKIFFGQGEIRQLGPSIRAYGRKVLLLYGKGSIKRNGIYDEVVNELLKHDISFVELSGVDPNPRISTVREGIKICRNEGVDFILAVGGGSAIDCAKGIAAGINYEGDPWDFYSYRANPSSALPLGAVLTLAATGSEMNDGSVITNEETKEKHGWGSALIFPKFSILDPTYTYTVSRHQTACGVVDILTHIYEFYFNTGEKAAITDSISEAIMKTVIHYGPIACREPDNYEARANLMWASSMALNGITTLGKSFDGFNHLTEHAISGLYDITHADGLSILAPHWMEYVLDDSTVGMLAQFARNVWSIEENDNYTAAKKGIEKTRNFYTELGMPVKLSQAGIDESGFDDIINNTFYGDTIGQFRPLTREDVRRILVSAL